MRRVREFEVTTEGTPTADLTVYGVKADDTEVEIASTTDSSLTLDTAYTFEADGEYIKLKFVASSSNGTNYYKIRTATENTDELATAETTHDLEGCDSGTYEQFATLTVDLITEINEVEFEFKSHTSSY